MYLKLNSKASEDCLDKNNVDKYSIYYFNSHYYDYIYLYWSFLNKIK